MNYTLDAEPGKFGATPGGMKLNVGCGTHRLKGYVNIDKSPEHGDIQCELGVDRLPYDDNTVEEILAFHVLEHIPNPLDAMQELYRVAKPDARILIRVPYGATATAWDDPTHVRPYFPSSFRYFSQAAYARADYGYRGDWIVETLRLGISGEMITKFQESQIDVAFACQHLFGVVEELLCILRAHKPARLNEPRPFHDPPIPVEILPIYPDDRSE